MNVKRKINEIIIPPKYCSHKKFTTKKVIEVKSIEPYFPRRVLYRIVFAQTPVFVETRI